MVSAARHFARGLRAAGFTVSYLQAPTTIDGLKAARAEYGDLPIVCAEPSSFRQYADLKKFGVEFVENDFFLTPRKLFMEWAAAQKTFLMENFYRKQRVRLGVLMEGNQPVGGAWNFDKENRLPPPKKYEGPAYVEHERDEIDREVATEFGYEPSKTWATARTGALAQLENFLSNHFNEFGPLEDAMTTDNWALHHSLLSPYLNVGLIHPAEVLEAAGKAFRRGNVAVESAEGFVRQVIGWREYVNGMYWFLGPEYREKNELRATRPLLPLFNDQSKTSMRCLKETVTDIQSRAWVHHIPRLMVLSNLALITGTNPQEFLQWMREKFIDASDWVMVPNVIGMGMHSDGGQMMTKPYISGGAYISKMSNYCKGCAYDPKLRTGDEACPFTNLYWNFLSENQERFARNHRMFQQLNGLKRLKDLAEVKKESGRILDGLSKGTI